jgi:hypothetical protein
LSSLPLTYSLSTTLRTPEGILALERHAGVGRKYFSLFIIVGYREMFRKKIQIIMRAKRRYRYPAVSR